MLISLLVEGIFQIDDILNGKIKMELTKKSLPENAVKINERKAFDKHQGTS